MRVVDWSEYQGLPDIIINEDEVYHLLPRVFFLLLLFASHFMFVLFLVLFLFFFSCLDFGFFPLFFYFICICLIISCFVFEGTFCYVKFGVFYCCCLRIIRCVYLFIYLFIYFLYLFFFLFFFF